jgi:hypothetical protein
MKLSAMIPLYAIGRDGWAAIQSYVLGVCEDYECDPTHVRNLHAVGIRRWHPGSARCVLIDWYAPEIEVEEVAA